MGESPRTLVILRHAKSAWPVGVPDDERPLSGRGRRDAPVAGRWIAENLGPVDLALVSSATRTQQTWELASAAMQVEATRTEPAIYLAAQSTLLDIVQSLPSDAQTVVLVGHNPGCEDLADWLAGSGDRDALFRMRVKYPTAGIAVLTCNDAWRKWKPKCAELVDFHIPRG